GDEKISPPRRKDSGVNDVAIGATVAATGDEARLATLLDEEKTHRVGTSTVPSGSAYSSQHAYGAPSTYDTAASVPTTNFEGTRGVRGEAEGNENRDEAGGAPEEMTDDDASALDHASTCAVRADSEE
ncbi:hypothetical protein BD311DRAFT_603449, partial [Dichomitus squalens]